MAAQLYETENFSIGQAAQGAGHDKREFFEILGTLGVSIFNCPIDDIDSDIVNAEINIL